MIKPSAPPRPFNLVLTHGYPYPYPSKITADESERHAEAAAGVRLEIAGVVNYQTPHTVTVEFATVEECEVTRLITGWRQYDHRILEAPSSDKGGYHFHAVIANNTAYCGVMIVAT
jgi:hypothetical protein